MITITVFCIVVGFLACKVLIWLGEWILGDRKEKDSTAIESTNDISEEKYDQTKNDQITCNDNDASSSLNANTLIQLPKETAEDISKSEQPEKDEQANISEIKEIFVETPVKVESVVSRIKSNDSKRKKFDQHASDYEYVMAENVKVLDISIDDERFKTDMAEIDESAKARVASLDAKLVQNHQIKNRHMYTVGIEYERYMGCCFELLGYRVEYRGATMGKADGGIDLVAQKDDQTILIQCKRYKSYLIQSKQILSFNDAVNQYRKKSPNDSVIGYFVTTFGFSEQAYLNAEVHGIQCRVIPMKRDYPMVKCVTHLTKKGEWRHYYYLPWMKSYDRVHVDTSMGDLYVATVEQAERLGYRPYRIPVSADKIIHEEEN